MPRESFGDLLAFLAVVRERSFTRAAAQLGISQSALSHTVRDLEARLGLRLLTRTTRSVASTEAGERLLRAVGPRFEEIDAELAALAELREKPAGTIRITAGEHKDMIAVRIGPDMRMAVVGAPAYFARRERPRAPQDLTAHACVNLRLPTRGGLYAWEFEKDGRELRVRVEGQLVFNNIALRLAAALAGLGLAYLPEDRVLAHLAEGRLVRVVADWCPPFAGYHLYYPSRRQPTPAFALLVEALRHRG